ncbi:MAG: hypothetical protein MJ211_13880 [Bacteroidales bacterium]|nr:hypothetical protein [Bacteroidales bacterium]
MKKLGLLLLVFYLCENVFAQGEIDTEKKILIRDEWSLGIAAKTNGFECDYRSGKFVSIYKKKLWDAGFSTIKHSQEFRRSNPYISGYGQYCYGKKNFCAEIFYSRGIQKNLFLKHDLNSIEFRFFYFGGVQLAFLKPIYYEIYYSAEDIRSEKCDITSPYQDADVTLGKSSFSKGFDEITVVPGAFVKAGFSFEFGKKDTKLTALEAGIKFSAFAKKLEIMDQDKNPQFITNLFVTFRFGRVMNGGQFKYLNDIDE